MSNKIQIPEPCHENWADFTPTEKGAFCQSCSIDVIDFSNKTPDQVKHILKENAGKHMCGRFRKSQLEDLNNNFFAWENQTPRSLQSKFMYACLIVFGMTLFSSCNLSEQNFLNQFGVSKVDEANAQLDVTNSDLQFVEKDTNKRNNSNKWEHLKGKVAYNPEDFEDNNEDTTKTCNTTVENEDEEIMVLGEFEATPIVDTVKQVQIEQDTLFNDEMIDGEIKFTQDFIEYIEDTTTTNVETADTSENIIIERHIKGEMMLPEDFIKTNETIEDSTQTKNPFSVEVIDNEIETNPDFAANLFPNPTIDQTKVVITVNKSSIFDIYLYAIDGKRVKDLYNGLLSTGINEFLVDLSSYEAGSYLIVINSEKQKESLRLEKLD